MTDIVLVSIAGVMFFTFFHYRHASWLQAPTVSELRMGETLPLLPGAESFDGGNTLILAMRNGCTLCENSMPFYKNLLALRSAGKIKARIIALMPDSPWVAKKFVSSHGLSVPVVPDVDFGIVGVMTTPTIILVNENRIVQRVWISEQSLSEQAAVIAELELPQASSASPRARSPNQPLSKAANGLANSP